MIRPSSIHFGEDAGSQMYAIRETLEVDLRRC